MGGSQYIVQHSGYSLAVIKQVFSSLLLAIDRIFQFHCQKQRRPHTQLAEAISDKKNKVLHIQFFSLANFTEFQLHRERDLSAAVLIIKIRVITRDPQYYPIRETKPY